MNTEKRDQPKQERILNACSDIKLLSKCACFIAMSINQLVHTIKYPKKAIIVILLLNLFPLSKTHFGSQSSQCGCTQANRSIPNKQFKYHLIFGKVSKPIDNTL